MLTTNTGAARIASCSSASWSTHTDTSGGTSDTDARLLAVMPSGRSSGPLTVSTVTPVAKRPMQLAELGGVDVRWRSEQHPGEKHRVEHRAGGHEVGGDADERVGQAPACEPAHGAVEQPGKCIP